MKAIIISAIYQKDINIEYYLNETKTLAQTLDIDVDTVFTQKLEKRDKTTYLNSGKIEEINEYIKANDIQLVIVQEEISASIERNLTKLLKIKVIDRTNLILDIFFMHAKSKLAKTQIEIARLEYNLSKVIGSYSNLEKQGSSAVSRSSGESKAELDKRNIRNKISKLKDSLNSQKNIRENKRKKRKDSVEPIISIVGYTNVGKSTLLNLLIDDQKQVLAKDQLFATLDTSVRKVSNKFGNFLFIDTVGFVSKLPHHLIEAFHSTFEEIMESDIIIHLHDMSDPNFQIHNKIVKDTLTKLEANEIPTIDVYNKVDAADDLNNELTLKISAKNGYGIDEMFLAIKDTINNQRCLTKMFFSYNQMKEYNFFKQNYIFESEEILNEGITICLYLEENTIKRYNKFIKE